MGALSWGDIFFDIEANQMAAEALRRGRRPHRRRTRETAAALTPTPSLRVQAPDHRPGLLRDVQPRQRHAGRSAQGPDRRGPPDGHRDRAGLHELDVIIYATGFDAMTGALTRIDIRGRDGMSLATSGPRRGRVLPRHGGRRVSPTCSSSRLREALRRQRISSPPWSSTWSGSATASRYLRANGYRTIEALPEAQREWIEHTTALVAPTVLVHPTCNSWYNGGNVPGKKRMYMGYTAGIPEYRRRCDEIAAAGYTGFKLAVRATSNACGASAGISRACCRGRMRRVAGSRRLESAVAERRSPAR